MDGPYVFELGELAFREGRAEELLEAGVFLVDEGACCESGCSEAEEEVWEIHGMRLCSDKVSVRE